MICSDRHGEMDRFGLVWRCGSCGREVPDLRRLPNMLAIPLQEAQAENHPVMRLHRLCDVAEILTRFCTILALSELRRRIGENPLPEPLLSRLQPQVQRPTWGQWLGMLEAIIAELDEMPDDVLPEFPEFVGLYLFALTPLNDDPEDSLLSLRNLLAHGGAMRSVHAAAFLTVWEPKLADTLAHLSFLQGAQVYHVSDGMAHQLVGPTHLASEDARPVADLLPGIDTRQLDNHVFLHRGGTLLDLWPLCDYDRAHMRGMAGPRAAVEPSPLLFFRAEHDRLLYAALGVELPLGEKSDGLETFRSIFRLDEPRDTLGAAELDFETEIRLDSAALVGRVNELKHSKDVLKAKQTGVLWLSGPGGIGKSFLAARLAHDYGNDAERICRIAWRFKTGDQNRGNRVAFLRHAIGKLAAWKHLNKTGITLSFEAEKLFDQLRGLLDAVARLTSRNERERPPRVLFILDGLDEIARLDESFVRLPFELIRQNVVWLCVGRPEGLAEVFSPDHCTHVFPGGLPPMSGDDIRGMLVDGTGGLKYDLLRLDIEHDSDDGPSVFEITNTAVHAVVSRAEGLPLYVHFVIEDILEGHFRFSELDDKLPPSLNAYYDELLKRFTIGQLQALLTPLVVTLAWAHAPLDEATLELLMVRRKVIREGDPSGAFRRGLQAVHSVIRRVRIPRLERVGYELYHPTFREHIRADKAGTIGDQNALARDEFCDLARDWAVIPENSYARQYSIDYGPRTLVDAGRWDDVEHLLCDLTFVETKCSTGLAYDLVRDYSIALESLPERQPQQRRKQQRDQLLKAYRQAIVDHARQLNDARGLHERDSSNPPLPAPEAIPAPEPPPLCSEVSGEADEKRDHQPEGTTRAGRLNAFASFVSTHSHWLAAQSQETILIARNHASDGLVKEQAEELAKMLARPWLARDPRPPCPPLLPICLRVLEGHSGQISRVATTADGGFLVSASKDSTVRIWHSETGQCLKVLRGHDGAVCDLAITPEGRWAVTGGDDGTLRIWDLEAGMPVRVLKGHEGRVSAVALTADGRRAFSAGDDKSFRIWDVNTESCVDRQDVPRGPICEMSATPDGRRLVAVTVNCFWLMLWDLDISRDPHVVDPLRCLIERPPVTSYTVDGSPIDWSLLPEPEVKWKPALALSDNGRWALTQSGQGVRIWDLDGNRDREPPTLDGWNRGWCRTVAIAPNGRCAASGSDSGNVQVWNLGSSQRPLVLEGHQTSVESVAVTADARLVFSGAADGSIRAWDLEGTPPDLRWSVHPHWDYVTAVALSQDGQTAISGDERKQIILWKTVGGQFRNSGSCRPWEVPKALAIAPQGNRALGWGGGDSSAVHIWLWCLDEDKIVQPLFGPTFGSLVTGLAFSQDGRKAIAATVHELLVWDLDSLDRLDKPEILLKTKGHGVLSPDGKKAILNKHDTGRLELWDTERGARLSATRDDWFEVEAVSAHGGLAVLRKVGGAIWAWDLLEDRAIQRLDESSTSIMHTFALSVDGKRVVSGGEDGLRVWDLGIAAQPRVLSETFVANVRIHPDGHLAVVNSYYYHGMDVWDLDRGEKITSYPTSASVTCISMLSTDDRLVCGTTSGEVHLLQMHNAACREMICESRDDGY